MLFLRCLACVCSEDTVSKKIFHFDICHCGIYELCQFSVLFVPKCKLCLVLMLSAKCLVAQAYNSS